MTTTSSTSAVIALVEPVITPRERLALAGFLAGLVPGAPPAPVPGAPRRHRVLRP